ncbi:hypothetical protein MSAN_00070300 [Mycena sanguinolenta]|uniref:AAA-ATPase-like domain-containing protein n=1 Tax=Mycena sanguinolenta TaxID=230812 RepID=A0A8H7DKB2_9AGAR|nr:hypothetical protein MSAN_00070300 [Mycena sanguinolenta]
MVTSDTVEIVHVASCPNSINPGVEICDCFKPQFDIGLDTKLIFLPPSSPSPGSTSSKRSFRWDENESSSDGERGQKRVKRRSLSPFLPHSRAFRAIDAFLHPPSDLFIDKTKRIIDLPDKFQCLVLRPPQFGKTMFLSTLYHFYDKHGTEQFNKRFGFLDVVTKAATPVQHNQHLCLSFDLSVFWVSSALTVIASRLKNQISHVLDSFLIEYATELDLSNPQNYMEEKDLERKFTKTFDLVRACGHSLFVGVDNYDSPTRKLTLAAHKTVRKGFATARDVENLLDSCLWRPLMAATDVIDKLWVTGALLVDYPSLRSLATDGGPGLDSVCGFTEEEAQCFAQSLVHEAPDMADLRRFCGSYVFSSQVAATQSLLHPRLLINRIFEMALLDAPLDEDSFELLSRILETVPEESDAPQAVTLNGLIELLATGAVDIGDQSAAPFDLAATKRVTWNDLHFAGALTYDAQSSNTFKIASRQALSLIHSRVDHIFDDRHELSCTITNALHHFSIQGDPEPFLELLSRVLCDLARRSFGRKHEPNLHGIFELVMRNSRCWMRDVHPIILQAAENCRYTQVPAYQPEEELIVELKTLTLRGMWHAVNLGEPTAEALAAFHEELVKLKEDELLARPYTTWSPTLNAMETVLVGSFFDSEPPENPRFLAVGGAHVLLQQRPRENI